MHACSKKMGRLCQFLQMTAGQKGEKWPLSKQYPQTAVWTVGLGSTAFVFSAFSLALPPCCTTITNNESCTLNSYTIHHNHFFSYMEKGFFFFLTLHGLLVFCLYLTVDFEYTEHCIWFSFSWQYIKDASRQWMFSRGVRTPHFPAEVSCHWGLDLNHWQYSLSRHLDFAVRFLSRSQKPAFALFLEMFQEPFAPAHCAHEQWPVSLGLSRGPRQSWIIAGGKKQRQMYREHQELMNV